MSHYAQSRLMRRFGEKPAPAVTPGVDPELRYVEKMHIGRRPNYRHPHEKLDVAVRSLIYDGYRYDHAGSKKRHWPKWEREAFTLLRRLHLYRPHNQRDKYCDANRHIAFLKRELRAAVRTHDETVIEQRAHPWHGYGTHSQIPGFVDWCLTTVQRRMWVYPSVLVRLDYRRGISRRHGITEEHIRQIDARRLPEFIKPLP